MPLGMYRKVKEEDNRNTPPGSTYKYNPDWGFLKSYWPNVHVVNIS